MPNSQETGSNAASRPRTIGRVRLMWRRYVQYHVTGWLDRRWEAQHPFPIKLGLGPWAHPESLWHECDGHEWVRIDWPYGRAVKCGYRPDRITRCRKCGAPRCGEGEDRPMQSCTLERHHREAHDYLDGTRIEVGA